MTSIPVSVSSTTSILSVQSFASRDASDFASFHTPDTFDFDEAGDDGICRVMGDQEEAHWIELDRAGFLY